MAKKKNRNKDFDSWLESINSNTYIPQMAQNMPNNANPNYFADGGPTMGFEYYDDGNGMIRSRVAAPTIDYNIANSPLMDHRTQGFDGTLKMDTLSRKDFDYRNMTPEQQTQFRDYNSNVRQNNRQYRQDVRDTKIADLNAKTDAGEGFLGKMNSNSTMNFGMLSGLASETARVWSDPNSTKLDKVANAFGIANISKLYSADTRKGDAKINEMTGRINDFKQDNIQDAWDTLGAGQALKLNKGPNQIQLMDPNSLGWKDFKRKGLFGLTVGAMGQGAASGSIGGPWGTLGGAVTGLFAGIGSTFGRKNRARKAYRAWKDNINYLNNNARMLNAQAQNEWTASNVNAIKNGVGQEKINDMANFRAYGGHLFEDGGNIDDDYIYEGRMLPEAVAEAESMPWYEKWYNKGKRNLIDPISNKAAYAYNYFRHNLFDVDDPAFFKDLSNKNVQRVTEDNQSGIDYILGNDFQEENQNDIRRKADFLNTSDTLLGDRKIPLSAISTYYGIEDGKLKAGTLDDFDDNTIVVPNRAKNIGKIKEYHPVSEEYKHNKLLREGAKKLAEMVDDERVVTKIFDRYFKQHPEKEKYLKQQIKDWYDIDNPTKNDLIQAAYDWDYNNIAQDPILKDYLHLSSDLWDYALATNEKPGFVVTENNDTIPNYQFNEEPKGMFADENGHSVFFSGKSEDNVKQINDFLSKYPSYPVMLDNGRYFNYTDNNNVNEYTGGFLDPQKGYIIGTEKALGGNLNMNDLSPNMINLWNNKQDIDQMKALNQYQSLGLGNSFNQKLNTFDFGGAMNGMDLPTGMQSYDTGGTHEENPNGGIQVGVDQQGNPNLVEEGEFRWGDYVFSDRILVDEDILSLYNAELNPNRSTKRKAKKGKLTYADLAKKYADKNKELVNDPIGKSTIDKYMENLSHAEEDQKMRAEEEKADRDYNNALANQTQGNPMYGSMKYNGMGNANTGLNEGNAVMGGMDNSGLSNVNRSGNDMLHAFGGNLYPYGGYTDEYGNPNPLYATPFVWSQPFGAYAGAGIGTDTPIKKGTMAPYPVVGNNEEVGDIYMTPTGILTSEQLYNLPTYQQQYQSNAVPETSDRTMVDADGNIITVNQATGEMFANGQPTGQTLDPSTLDVNQPGYNYTAPTSKDFGLSLSGSNPTSDYLYTGDEFTGWQATPVDYGKKYDAITGNPYLSQPTINPLWDRPNLNPLLRIRPYNPDEDPLSKEQNFWRTTHMFASNASFNPNNDVNPYVKVNLWTKGPDTGQRWRERNPFPPDGEAPQTPPANNPPQTNPPQTNIPPAQDTPPAAKVPPVNEVPNTNTGGGNSTTGGSGKTNTTDITVKGGGPGSGMRSNIDVTGNPGNLNAQYAAGNPWQSTPYQEWTRFGNMIKGMPWVNSDAMGHTNWEYKINNIPPDRMEALGRTGTVLRNAVHNGDYVKPELVDVERQNNAAQAQAMSNSRAIQNMSNGRSTALATQVASDYNNQMGSGNNYAQTADINAGRKLQSAEFNKQTNQFNVNNDNTMLADNQKAKQFGKTYQMTGLNYANAERLHERNLKDATDRLAAADRTNNVTNVWDNALEFMAGEADRNHQFNMANSNPINQYYWDKYKRQYKFKNDPNNPMLRMNDILRQYNMGPLSANSQKLLNSYIQQYGNNVPQEMLNGLVEAEEREQKRLAAEKKATTDASYRDLENEYDMLLADYKRRMGMKADDGTTPKFANYTQDEYQAFDDLRNKPKLDEAGNPIYDEDYYSRLRMRANMMKNMMYGANSYYNTPVTVGAYGGKICTRKKKQHYYMDV